MTRKDHRQTLTAQWALGDGFDESILADSMRLRPLQKPVSSQAVKPTVTLGGTSDAADGKTVGSVDDSAEAGKENGLQDLTASDNMQKAVTPPASPEHKRRRLASATGNSRLPTGDGFGSSPTDICQWNRRDAFPMRGTPTRLARRAQSTTDARSANSSEGTEQLSVTPAARVMPPPSQAASALRGRPTFTSLTPLSTPVASQARRFTLVPSQSFPAPNTQRPHYLIRHPDRNTGLESPAPDAGVDSPATDLPQDLGAIFSPHHRRRTRFLESGMAATARSWILDAADRNDIAVARASIPAASAEVAVRATCVPLSLTRVAGQITVLDAVRAGRGCSAEPTFRVMLVGKPSGGLDQRWANDTQALQTRKDENSLALKELKEGAVVVLGTPSWEIVIRDRSADEAGGEDETTTWVICANWRRQA